MTLEEVAKLRCPLIDLSALAKDVDASLHISYAVLKEQEKLTRLYDGVKPINGREDMHISSEKYTYNIFNQIGTPFPTIT